MPRILVLGAGHIGLSNALHLHQLDYQVELMAPLFPGDGITSDWAAGIFCRFRPSAASVEQFVDRSYDPMMEMSVDHLIPAVTPTTLVVEMNGREDSYKDKVRGFKLLGNNRAQYDTCAIDPVGLGKWRLEQFTKAGGKVLPRALNPSEVECLRDGRGLPDYDYTLSCLGLNFRDVSLKKKVLGHVPKPMRPARGLLVHFAPEGGLSFMDESAPSYVVRRNDADVVGGTYELGVGTYSERELVEIGARIVNDANARFDTRFDFSKRKKITAGFRPVVNGDPIMIFLPTLGVVTGFGGQGLITNPAVVASVAEQVGLSLAG